MGHTGVVHTDTAIQPAGSARQAVAHDDPLGQFLAGQLTERTRRAYYSDLCEFFGTERLTSQLVQSIRFTDIIEYRNDLAQLGRKRATINRKLASIKAFFKMMVGAGVIDKNPADSTLVRGFRIDETVTGKAIQQAALRKILKAVSKEENDLTRCRDLAIIHLLTYGGLRRSEVANIDWRDLGQEGAFFILRLPTTKSGVAQDIKLQPIVLHHLEEYREALKGNSFDAQGKAFISLSRNHSRGKPLTDQSINLIAHKYAKAAGCQPEGHCPYVPTHMLHSLHRRWREAPAGAGALATQGPQDYNALLREPREAHGQRL